MFRVVAAIWVTVFTMLAVNDVGTVSCSSGKTIGWELPFVIGGVLLFTLFIGYMSAKGEE